MQSLFAYSDNGKMIEVEWHLLIFILENDWGIKCKNGLKQAKNVAKTGKNLLFLPVFLVHHYERKSNTRLAFFLYQKTVPQRLNEKTV